VLVPRSFAAFLRKTISLCVPNVGIFVCFRPSNAHSAREVALGCLSLKMGKLDIWPRRDS